MPRRILAGFLLGLFVLTSAAVLLARSIRTLHDERVPAGHARNELEALIAFLATADEAETGQRGYLLTGDSAYLAPYVNAQRTMNERLGRLDTLTRDDPTQRAAVATLRLHVTVKMAELAESIRLHAGSPEAAQTLIGSGTGRREMASIRRIVEALRQEERRRLDEHLHAFTSSVATLTIYLAFAIALQFLLLGLLLLFTKRDQAFRAAASTRLTNEREFLRALLDNLSEGVAAMDKDGRPTMSNRAFRTLFGVDATTATDSAWTDLLVRAARGEQVTGTAFALDAGEETRYIVANGQPIRDASGQQVGAVVAFRDITQEYVANAALQASEERFRRLSDAATDGVVVSRHGIVLEVNAAWCRMCGADESALIGTPIAQFVSPGDRDAVARIMRENRVVTYTLECLRLDGTTFDGQVTARPIIYRGQAARISIVRDVSEWTRVNRLKSEFVSTVSHELRTPLTSIHGALKLVASGAMGVLPAKAAHLVTIARTNSERLVRLVGDMLDLDKIEAGKLEMRAVTLAPADVVRSALDGIRAMAEEYRMRLDERVATHRTFNGDRDRVIQVLTNLIANAIKFAPSDTVVSIAATDLVAPSEDRVRFAVTNQGPGIQPSDMALLFTRFQQLDGSDARRRGGTGLGLAICKAIVEQHGGTIGVDSEPGAATTFWFELPVTRPAASMASLPA